MTPAPTPGRKLLGYVTNDTGAVVSFAPVVQRGDTLSLTLSHFSGAGFGKFVQTQVPLLPLLGTPWKQKALRLPVAPTQAPRTTQLAA